ncbi:MAG: enoyl-ACP reductase [Verrucomicrobiota bacterium JB023]|nr:enoyl-ACP reductase [Verrucomicrobiota bacterium JB023]
MSEGEKQLAGKVGLVFGVANKRSIAWLIAKAWREAGATVIIAYQNERVRDNVKQLLEPYGEEIKSFPCDVARDEEIESLFSQVRKWAPRIDMMLHSVAFAPKEALEGRFVETSREAFRVAQDISSYSLIALSRAALPLMAGGGSIMALSYYGSVKVVPSYNVMGVAKASLEASARYLADDLGPQGIRVNCISAGPMQTLASRGISGFGDLARSYREKAPLRRSCSASELGATGVFLASDGSAAITGQVLYVDGGYEIMGA